MIRHVHRSARTRLVSQHPARLLHPRRAACRRASTRPSTAASARRTIRRTWCGEPRGAWPATLGVAPESARQPAIRSIRPTRSSSSAPWPGERPQADGMVTRVPGLALAVTTADCGPVLFADPQARVIGAAHAGWRGALAGVLEAHRRRDGAASARGATGSSPCSARRSAERAYEVGPEFVARFRDADAGERPLLRAERPRRAMPCSTCPASSARGSRRPASANSPIWACAPMPTRSVSSATAARPIAASRTTAG